MTQPVAERLVYTRSADSVVTALTSSLQQGLTDAEAEQRLDRYGPNVLPRAPTPTAWRIAVRQWAEPMNVMLTVVALVSALIAQEETALLVGFLVLLNVVLGSRQELKAQASVAALSSMQVPTARVLRSGATLEIPAEKLVPGDMTMVEAGDLIPADGRIVTSASLEVAESALTGESAPVGKDARALHDPDAALGDRSNMLFQNTSVTRGTATFVVTGTGAGTEMGRIADMLNAVEPVASPLQKEMRDLSIRLMWVAWVAVAIIVGLGLWRGGDLNTVVLLGITTAIAAIPSGLPTFLTAMLSYGAQRLAKAKAVVKNLNDVETLGATSAINSDKTGTLTMDMMTATRMFAFGQWFSIEGRGYEKSGAILHAAGRTEPDFDALGYGLALCEDATVDDNGEVIGDPTEAALVVLAAKMGVDAPVSRREYPREAEVPFDSRYKFMATFHLAPMQQQTELIGLVKGAPDVVLERCASAYLGDEVVPVDQMRDQILQANQELAGQGLRVMSFAIRRLPVDDLSGVQNDPMASVADLTFVALVGIIDPLRPSAKDAVQTALGAGIDVRMITGDHAVTARAIGSDLGLGPGVITGPEFQALSDAQISDRLPELHIFGRVAPEDKLRLVSVMQDRGEIVAMTGDAVNDAAALKKADVGVAMGSGSEVSKESAKMILTDDNFATLVNAIELGRDIYGKITAQVRYVLIGLFGFVGVMLLGSILNLNSGSVLNPLQLLFVSFLIGLFPALGISTDSTEPGIMTAPPRDPGVTILNSTTTPRWVIFGLVQAGACLLPFVWQHDLGPERTQTMTFAILAISTVFLAISARRDLLPATAGPYYPYFLWMALPALLTVLAVEMDVFQRMLDTTSLTGSNWLAVVGLALIVPAVMEGSKAFRRARQSVRSTPEPVAPAVAVSD